MATHAPAEPNPFELVSRYKKVIRLLSAIPAFTGRPDAAEFFAAFTTEERSLYARVAGVKMPSAETWRMFVQALRDREGA